MMMLALVLAFAGCVCLSLAMDRHYGQVMAGRPIPRQRHLARVGGVLLLGLSSAICIAAYGWSIGLACWFGLVALAATVLQVLLAYRPTIIPTAAICAVLLAGGGVSLSQIFN
ncbi:DUF3325 domain-containing protein [Sphingomonadaceae bacterium jetA1]|jgi:ABC-type uncharacterized transport system permease subunit|uniref:DUF3325 domain-containing protein n=1 Tax=Facivitalis istanbulensis TaxID=3075838 RepID=UPI003475E49A